VTTAPGDALLEPELLARLERLQLSTRRRLAGLYAGEHRSIRHGSSLDFADHRPYQPGDDIRRIDHITYARLDLLLVRLFEADDDITVRLLVDTSASMGYYGKLRHAQRIAAALGFCALVRRDAVAVHTVVGARAGRRFTSRSAMPALFSYLSSLQPAGATPFLAAVSTLLAEPGPRGLTVVISDLLTEDWSVALRRLPARGSDVVVVHLLAREELDPGAEADIRGDIDLVDGETGRPLGITASTDELAEHARRLASWRGAVAAACSHSGAAYVPVVAGDDIGELLLGPMRASEVLR
jgi:uncharacterized protein (DUF58 family)